MLLILLTVLAAIGALAWAFVLCKLCEMHDEIVLLQYRVGKVFGMSERRSGD